ncbi:MAG: alpha/beta fold hydrolase [Rhodoferax sp.]|nr:MAG: alpha/beta fold hydrolase [Rhodoferax sp.]
MLARLLRRALLVQYASSAALAWLLYRQGAVGVLAACLLTMALPFALTALAILYTGVVSRAGESATAWCKSVLGEAWASCVVFMLRQPWTLAPPALQPALAGVSQRLPVVLVHGYLCNHRLWDTIAPTLTARGHAVQAVNLEPLFTSIDDYAVIIEDAVQKLLAHTGQQQVVLVGHSMGGLAIRAWLRLYGPARVAKVITLGTPHTGTQVPQHLATPNGRQMAWQSPWLAELEANESASLRSLFEIALTPQDNIVYPQRAQVMPGVPVTVFEGIGHLQMCLHPPVIAWLLQKLDGVAARA